MLAHAARIATRCFKTDKQGIAHSEWQETLLAWETSQVSLDLLGWFYSEKEAMQTFMLKITFH